MLSLMVFKIHVILQDTTKIKIYSTFNQNFLAFFQANIDICIFCAKILEELGKLLFLRSNRLKPLKISGKLKKKDGRNRWKNFMPDAKSNAAISLDLSSVSSICHLQPYF